MREVADLSYEEIALQTGISIGTVRSRLSRAGPGSRICCGRTSARTSRPDAAGLRLPVHRIPRLVHKT
ncbi:MAG: Sigma-70, region 4 [Candidatus Eremiobacteraeota bacterium]|nr:Sigma-70, region 4 [Candidatus Eremiobacteraeota bacterium]